MGENDTIPRICFSDSIKGCLQAIQYYHIGDVITVYEHDFDENDNALITPKKLKTAGLVGDALTNREYWYTKSIVLEPCQYLLEDYDISFDIAFESLNVNDIKSLIVKYINKYNLSIDKSCLSLTEPEVIYQSFMKWMSAKRLDDEQDAFYDEIAELPWAQVKRIQSIKLKPLIKEKETDLDNDIERE